MENRKLNIILCIISALLIFFTIYIFVYIKNIKDNKVMFHINEIINNKYTSQNCSFYTNGKTFTLIIDDETIANGQSLNFNDKTGEILKDELYIRNINSKYIIIWYDKQEYKLYK